MLISLAPSARKTVFTQDGKGCCGAHGGATALSSREIEARSTNVSVSSCSEDRGESPT